MSISCHFQFDFEVRKGAKDSEKANPLRASRSPRQSTAARPRYDFSQNRSTTHRERPRWRRRCDAPKRGPPQSTVASSRPRRLQGMPQTQMQKRFPKTRSPPPPELCSITFREGFQNRIGSVTFREGLQKRIGPVTFGGGAIQGCGEETLFGTRCETETEWRRVSVRKVVFVREGDRREALTTGWEDACQQRLWRALPSHSTSLSRNGIKQQQPKLKTLVPKLKILM